MRNTGAICVVGAMALVPMPSNATVMDTVKQWFLYALTGTTADQGRWLCVDCKDEINLIESGGALPAGGITMAFIRGVVNPALFKQIDGVTGPVRGWVSGQRLTICDGIRCMLLIYKPQGHFERFGGATVDNGSKYKNGVDSNGSGTSPSSGVNIIGVPTQLSAPQCQTEGYYETTETWMLTTYTDESGKLLGASLRLFATNIEFVVTDTLC